MMNSPSSSLKRPTDDPKVIQQIAKYDYEKQKINPGKLGQLFGSPDYAPTNIIGLLLIFLIVIGSIYSCIPDNLKSFSTYQFWTLILPVITTIIGYLFGKKK